MEAVGGTEDTIAAATPTSQCLFEDIPDTYMRVQETALPAHFTRFTTRFTSRFTTRPVSAYLGTCETHALNEAAGETTCARLMCLMFSSQRLKRVKRKISEVKRCGLASLSEDIRVAL